MAQNIYDQADFYENYGKLPRSVEGLAAAKEWIILKTLVGDVTDKQVLDLGCGFGWFCRWAAEAGAKSVHGVDISENMLGRAKELTAEPTITYGREDLETISLPTDSYDLVYSSLALHYLPDVRPLFAKIYKSLRPKGKFVFSIEHPLWTAIPDADWKVDEAGKLYWPMNNYLDEGLRVTNWLAEGVRKHHRTSETYISALLEAGFILTAYREFWNKTQVPEKGVGHRPWFLIISVQVPESKGK